MGSIFKRNRKRKDGSVYEVWVCEDEWEGVSKTLTGKTEKEAKSKIKAWIKEMATNGEKLSKTKDTFSSYFNKYLFDVVINDVEASTFSRYKGIYDKYIKDSKLAHHKLDAISCEDIQLYFNDLTDLSSASMNKIKSLINGCFKYAKRNKIIRENPLEDFSIPRSKKQTKKIRIMTLDEQSRYIKALEGSKLKTALMLTMFTGIRLGELIALTWDKIDLENGILLVDESIKRTRVYNKDGSHVKKNVTKSTKTNRSRGVPIPTFLIDSFKSMDNTTKYVFVSSSGKHYSAENVRREHINICSLAKIGQPSTTTYHRNYKQKNGVKRAAIEKEQYLDVNFHSLRHTYATRLYKYGESEKMIQTLLGHTKLSTTMDIYTHIFEEDKKEVTDKLNQIYNDIL